MQFQIVSYDRSERVYNVFDPHSGELADTFPRGINGKRAAFQLAVKLRKPQLHQLATDWIAQSPELESRIWKACQIVLDNHVLPAFSMQHLAVVKSQSSVFGDYNIAMRDQMLQCECPDFESFAAPMVGENMQPMCKHLIAYVMHAKIQQEIPA